MELALALLLFLLLAGTICVLGYRSYVKPVRLEDRLDEAAGGLDAPEKSSAAKEQIVRVIEQIGEKAPISPRDAKLSRRLLMSAGYRDDTAVRVFYGLKIVFAAVGLGAAFLFRGSVTNPVSSLMIIPGLCGIGFFLPNFVLGKLIARRQERLRFSLPDALDLMVVCMEAGLGLDQALTNVSRELRTTHPDIAEELSLVTLEMRHGKRRVEALKNLADRNGEPELRKLVATMVQADRFGTSVGESLRTHSDFMRVRRRQEAEERAAKVGVKLVFPIFFFILPAMLIVAAGPGLLALMKNLFPMMRNF